MNEAHSRPHAERHAAFLVRLDDETRALEIPEEITRTAARLLGEHLDVERCAYADVEGDADTFNLTGDYNRGVPSIVGRYRFAQFGDECLRLMRAGEAYIVEDSESDPRTDAVRDAYRQTLIRAVVCVPLLKAGRFVAAMAVHRTQPRRWSADEVELIKRVASRCWESIERARIGRELRRQWYLFDSALSHSPDFIYIFDREGRFRYVNRALLALWQKPLGEALGRNLFELDYPRELAERLQRQIGEVIATRAMVRDQTPFTGPTGETRHYEYIFVPVFADDGSVESVAGSTRDITDRLRIEEDLRQANDRLLRSNRELEQFAYIVSHDLQEPLRMVSSFVTLLDQRSGTDLGPTARGYIARAIDGTRRMRTLIRDLLTYARLGEHPPFASVALARVFEVCVDNLSTRIAEAQATVTSDALPIVHGDEGQLVQLLQNLIGNALKFRAPSRPPAIHVSSTSDGATWTVAVRDNGIGISQEQQQRIFEVFHRVHGQEHYEGTGIGLAICKKIVERHGGAITVEAQEGVGSTFAFRLPRPA